MRDAFRAEELLDSHWAFLGRLLELGADPNTRDSSGAMPLHATIPFFPEIAHRLLHYGADPILESGGGESAIDRAVYYQAEQKGILSDSQEQALRHSELRGAPAQPIGLRPKLRDADRALTSGGLMAPLPQRGPIAICLAFCLLGCGLGRSSEVQFGSAVLHRVGTPGATVLDFAAGHTVPGGAALQSLPELGGRLEDETSEQATARIQQTMVDQHDAVRSGIREGGDLAYYLDSLWAGTERIASISTDPVAAQSGVDLAPLFDLRGREANEANRPGETFLVETRGGGHAVVRVDEIVWQKSLRIRWAYRADGIAVFPDLSPLDSLAGASDPQLDRQLLFAAREKNAAEVIRLLDAGANPNSKMDSRPLLFWATSPEIVSLLIEAGADVAARNSRTETPLHTYAGDVVILRILLAAGADPTAEDHRGNTPIELAAELEAPVRDEVLPLLRAALPPGGGSLWVAARLGELERAAELIDQGAEVDAVDPLGRTALHLAAYYGQVEMIRFLLESGADPNIKHEIPKSSQDLETPLVSAVRAGQREAVRVLIPVTDPALRDVFGAALGKSIEGNHVEIAALLLDAGVDPALWVAKRGPPLHSVWDWGKPEMVDLFQARGYDMTLWTMLRLEREAEVDRMIAAGADVDAPIPPNLQPPLARAVKLGRTRVVAMLLERGASPDTRGWDRSGRSVLHEAPSTGSKEILALLLQFGADPNVVDAYGATPLYRVVGQGIVDLAEMLLEAGADPNLHPEGEPPAIVATTRKPMQELLRSYQ
jgi:ankyrin repeat protein